MGFHLLIGTALQGKPPNAANNVLPGSVIAFMVCFFFSRANNVQKGKGKAIDPTFETSCKQL